MNVPKTSNWIKINLKKCDLSLLNNKAEMKLIKVLLKFPELIKEISKNYNVHKLTYYSLEIAESFHSIYKKCQVLRSEKNLLESRLALITATKIVLERNFNLLKISLPKKM